jgi:hypothetical protein
LATSGNARAYTRFRVYGSIPEERDRFCCRAFVLRSIPCQPSLITASDSPDAIYRSVATIPPRRHSESSPLRFSNGGSKNCSLRFAVPSVRDTVTSLKSVYQVNQSVQVLPSLFVNRGSGDHHQHLWVDPYTATYTQRLSFLSDPVRRFG